MDVDSQVVSKEMLLNSSRHNSVTKATCMNCVIEVVITENLRMEDDALLHGGKPQKVELFAAMIEEIPPENRPAFLTARKAEIEDKIDNVDDNERQELQMVLGLINQKIQNNPWGEY